MKRKTDSNLGERKKEMSIQIQLPEKVKRILERLQDEGYEAYAVGGCVRDSLLGRIPDDWDITTSAKPIEIKNIFERTVDTGIQHGTVTVLIDHEGFEVTTYRIDGEYTDSRHPKEVVFTSKLKEDLRRRDFTINAMAYNEEQGLVDEFGGAEDLEKKQIRCVGNAQERFGEDALRILRAVRFSAQLGFKIEKETRSAIKKLAPNLKNISAERIQTELVKLLLSPSPETILDAAVLGITKAVMPELDEAFEKQRIPKKTIQGEAQPCLDVLRRCSAEKSMRLAALMQYFGAEEEERVKKTKTVLRRLKFDNHTIEKTVKLVRFCTMSIKPDRVSIRKAVYTAGEETFPSLLKLWRANLETEEQQEEETWAERQNNLKKIETLYEEILKAGDCLSLKTLAVTGNDLIEAGIKPGKEIGLHLARMLDDVLEHPEHNTREYLLYSVLT